MSAARSMSVDAFYNAATTLPIYDELRCTPLIWRSVPAEILPTWSRLYIPQAPRVRDTQVVIASPSSRVYTPNMVYPKLPRETFTRSVLVLYRQELR